MTADLALPGLVAGRDLAAELVASLGDVTGRDIVIDARALSSGTSSFAAQVVRSALLDGGAAALVVVGAPAPFAEALHEAAGRLQVGDRLRLTEHATA